MEQDFWLWNLVLHESRLVYFACSSYSHSNPISTECVDPEDEQLPYSTRANDVWSLGVILVNMITGQAPWSLARSDDERFKTYTQHPDFLYHVLPISSGANAILKRIFTLDAFDRITLPELRSEIMRLPSFFMDEDELMQATDTVRAIADSYATRLPIAGSATIRKYGGLTYTDPESSASSDSDESDGPPLDIIWPTSVDSRIPSVDITDSSSESDSECTAHFLVGNSGNSGNTSPPSSDESDGPITPETQAVEPAIQIPDISQGEHIIQPPAALGKPPVGKKLSSPTTVLCQAVHELVIQS